MVHSYFIKEHPLHYHIWNSDYLIIRVISTFNIPRICWSINSFFCTLTVIDNHSNYYATSSCTTEKNVEHLVNLKTISLTANKFFDHNRSSMFLISWFTFRIKILINCQKNLEHWRQHKIKMIIFKSLSKTYIFNDIFPS